MRAYPYSVVGHLAQQWIKHRTVEPLLNRVHPDENTVETEKLLTHRGNRFVGVDDRFCCNPELREGSEYAMQPACRNIDPARTGCVPLLAPEQSDPESAHTMTNDIRVNRCRDTSAAASVSHPTETRDRESLRRQRPTKAPPL